MEAYDSAKIRNYRNKRITIGEEEIKLSSFEKDLTEDCLHGKRNKRESLELIK